VLEGAVADLVEQSGSTLVAVAGDPTAAAAALSGLPGITDVAVEADGRVRVRGTTSRPAIVRALVDACVAVESVDGRRQLEEVFMGLIGDGQGAQVDRARAAVPS
jgi:ABC-2 type transport system ATP-binding protein